MARVAMRRPEIPREGVERGDAGLEGADGRAAGRGGNGGRGKEAAASREEWGGAGFEGTGSAVHAQQVFGKRLRDVGAGADAALEVALGEELVEGAGDGVARDGKVGGEGAGGGEAVSGGEAAGEDRGAELIVELALEREARAAVEVDSEKWHHGDSRNGPFRRATFAL